MFYFYLFSNFYAIYISIIQLNVPILLVLYIIATEKIKQTIVKASTQLDTVCFLSRRSIDVKMLFSICIQNPFSHPPPLSPTSLGCFDFQKLSCMMLLNFSRAKETKPKICKKDFYVYERM